MRRLSKPGRWSVGGVGGLALQVNASGAKSWVEQHEPSRKDPKHAGQWRSTLATYAKPVIGHLVVGDIATPHVLQVLEPIWMGHPAYVAIEQVSGWVADGSWSGSGQGPESEGEDTDGLFEPSIP